MTQEDRTQKKNDIRNLNELIQRKKDLKLNEFIELPEGEAIAHLTNEPTFIEYGNKEVRSYKPIGVEYHFGKLFDMLLSKYNHPKSTLATYLDVHPSQITRMIQSSEPSEKHIKGIQAFFGVAFTQLDKKSPFPGAWSVVNPREYVVEHEKKMNNEVTNEAISSYKPKASKTKEAFNKLRIQIQRMMFDSIDSAPEDDKEMLEELILQLSDHIAKFNPNN